MLRTKHAKLIRQHSTLKEFAESVEECLFQHYGDTVDRYKVADHRLKSSLKPLWMSECLSVQAQFRSIEFNLRDAKNESFFKRYGFS
jgi:hypothetical protein